MPIHSRVVDVLLQRFTVLCDPWLGDVESHVLQFQEPVHVVDRCNILVFFTSLLCGLMQMGYTPLHQAAQQGHVMAVNILLKYNASPNAVTAVSNSL